MKFLIHPLLFFCLFGLINSSKVIDDLDEMKWMGRQRCNHTGKVLS